MRRLAEAHHTVNSRMHTGAVAPMQTLAQGTWSKKAMQASKQQHAATAKHMNGPDAGAVEVGVTPGTALPCVVPASLVKERP